MKILVAGLGSIGQRHVRNLRALRGDDVEILAYRVRGCPDVITSQMTIDRGSPVEATYNIRPFQNLDAALAERPDAVIVSNPTRHHMPTALAAARAGCHVLIEKPLSDSMEAVDELSDLADRQGIVAVVGYQLRCHPGWHRLRSWLCRKAIGRLTSVRAEFGEYLPAAHPYEDYRQSYAARRDLGGGVILCYIHEIDYLCWLFGMPRRVRTTGGRLGDLEIDVEDTAVTRLDCAVDGRPLPVELRQSFLQRPTARWCTIEGELGTIHFDLNAPRLEMMTKDGTKVDEQTFEGFQRNDLFVDELRHFLGAVDGQRAPLVPVREAARSLRVALAARRSLDAGTAIELT